MNNSKVEIEKKYIIELPSVKSMESMPGYDRSDITQIYLMSVKGVTHRIRRRVQSGNVTFTETKKVRIDRMSAFEDEREIGREDYERLYCNIDPETRPIIKTRHTFTYLGQLFEIDVYPEWQHNAILETELDDREKTVDFPPFIKIVREVTGDKRYSNAGMSRAFPKE
ncbi:MAG: hypothetical protein IJX92_03135 [Clostridia bacterium]|nr:hypothetical protein [Clostridia bacterium]